MRAFVTGSTGLLGNNLVKLLLEQGHEVKALVRSKEKSARQFAGFAVTSVEGDMLDIAAFAPALEGCDVLFHTAAYFHEYYQGGEDEHLFTDINVDGTIKLLTAAEEAGLRKAIYVSSSAVIGGRVDGQPADETTPPDPITKRDMYFNSKVRAELAIADFLKTHQLPVILILPGLMFGPGDAAPTGTGQIVISLLNRQLPIVVPGQQCIVDARDVAQAMINSVELGQSGERYLVAGRMMSMAEVIKTVAQVSGVPAPRLRLPYPVVQIVASLVETGARLTGNKPLVTRNSVRVLAMNLPLNSAKAERELGASFRSIKETLRDEVAWYLTNQPEVLTKVALTTMANKALLYCSAC